jgi:hypothetical protein
MFKVGGKVRCIKKGPWKNADENERNHSFNDPTYGQILTVEEIDDEQGDGEVYLGFSGINDAVYLSIHFIPLEETGDIFIESILEEIYLSNV